MDRMSKEARSKLMSSIRSRWTKPERKLHNCLKGHKIRHEMHPKMAGSPDAILKDRRIAIFVDSCFFHKCPKCYTEPQTNRKYWIPKIEANVRRDRRDTRVLRKAGWKVIRIWEHELKKKDIEPCMRKLRI